MLHPGYGFLAENAGFVDICKEHGINFIGPNVSNLFAQISFGNITLGNLSYTNFCAFVYYQKNLSKKSILSKDLILK